MSVLSTWLRARTPVDPELPRPVVEPRTPAALLIAQAEAQGAADARRHVRDGWSFGGPDDGPSEAFDPEYVKGLRRLCDAAVHSALERHALARERTSHLRARADEANRLMVAARSQMDRLAADAARRVSAGETPAEDVADDDPVWEGETVALPPVWRLVVLLGLVVAQVPVHYLVFRHFLAGRVETGAIWAVCGSMAVFLVAAPHVAALLVRARQATGTERRLTAVVLVTGVFWALVVGVLGVLCGGVLELNRERLAPLNLTSTTLVLMFVGGLVVAGAMAFMLGLSRRHPFQEAYARHRRRRDRAEAARRALVDRLNPEHVEDGGPEALVQAVRAAYAAAEEAYFAALAQAVGDPAFTDAVQHRRGLRPAGAP
ncbi:hypothetical protein AB0A74_04100 [Saccharothrix sp. NPDC042600]|uniref:hypothetical protein n=1 Tax=Saccharothrix TaxID=2071 RepID=UPI0033F97736|nr:hypothetical protein GCM10017745_88730 [Saccharothrix mutabilis subsp. capreolus]